MHAKLSVVALSVACALAACGQKEEPKPAGAPETVVRIGHVAPMTGP